MDIDDLDSWRACNELTLVQAALLIAGHNPSEMQSDGMTSNGNGSPNGYDAAITAVSLGLRQGIIEGRLCPQQENRLDDEVVYIRDSIDLKKSTVMVDSLTEYLASRGITKGFFFRESTNKSVPNVEFSFLNPNDARYSPKLAAAVKAWIAVGEYSDNSPRTPKQLLEEWLNRHAAQLGLTDKRGNPIKQAIKEIAKVANWKPTGGAPKTPFSKIGPS